MEGSFLAYSARDIAKMIRQAFPYLLKEHGFRVYRNTTAVRLSEYVLQGICFDPSSHSHTIYLTVFVQPLFIPLEYIVFTHGDRLVPLDKSAGYGGHEFDQGPEKIAQVLADMHKQIEAIALPFLGDSVSIKALTSDAYQAKWSRFWGNSVSVDKHRCYLYAFIGENEKFLQTFGRIYPVISTDDRDWAVEDFKRLCLIRDNLERPADLMAQFREYYNQTISAFRFEKHGIQPTPPPGA